MLKVFSFCANTQHSAITPKHTLQHCQHKPKCSTTSSAFYLLRTASAPHPKCMPPRTAKEIQEERFQRYDREEEKRQEGLRDTLVDNTLPPSSQTVADERQVRLNRSAPEAAMASNTNHLDPQVPDRDTGYDTPYDELTATRKCQRTNEVKKRKKHASKVAPSAAESNKGRKRGAADAPAVPATKKTKTTADYDNDIEVASSLDDSDAAPPSLRPGADTTPTPGAKQKKGTKVRSKAKKGKKMTEEELEETSVSGPFGGVVKVLKGDDIEALMERSRRLPNSEMLAFRQRIWDMCERCARYIGRGTSTHPFRIRYLCLANSLFCRHDLLWR